MNRLLLGLMLLLTATAAMAEWTQVGESDDNFAYVDMSTIRRNGNLVKIWQLLDYKTVQTDAGDPYLSNKSQWEYDCKEEIYRFLAFSHHRGQMGGGGVSLSDGSPSPSFPVSPNSLGQTIWKLACGKR